MATWCGMYTSTPIELDPARRHQHSEQLREWATRELDYGRWIDQGTIGNFATIDMFWDDSCTIYDEFIRPHSLIQAAREAKLSPEDISDDDVWKDDETGDLFPEIQALLDSHAHLTEFSVLALARLVPEPAISNRAFEFNGETASGEWLEGEVAIDRLLRPAPLTSLASLLLPGSTLEVHESRWYKMDMLTSVFRLHADGEWEHRETVRFDDDPQELRSTTEEAE
jgi:hypothetical protein